MLAGDFVTTEDGTGTVHMAPGFGEDDQRVCEEHGIPRGRARRRRPAASPPRCPTSQGLQVFDANTEIITALRANGALVRQDSYEPQLPALLAHRHAAHLQGGARRGSSRVTAIKDRMVELNQEINWVPEHVRDGRFGNWLADARDWSISRNRFWGSPHPGVEERRPRLPPHRRLRLPRRARARLRRAPGRPPPAGIDELTRPNPDDPTGQSTMRRVEDVLDCWFDSGSMPFAQVHYPFENREWFDDHFPADFIVEYIGQTRGWFYTLHVLATALFDRPPFENCIAHGVLLGDDGRKLSKRLRNYPDPDEVFDTFGADAMRWALLSSPVLRGGDLVVSRKNMTEAVRSVLNPIWNAYGFFTLYANTDGYRAAFRTDAPGVLDRYILAKTRQLIEGVEARLDAYDIDGACAVVAGFLDALTNWYIRRSPATGSGPATTTPSTPSTPC